LIDNPPTYQRALQCTVVVVEKKKKKKSGLPPSYKHVVTRTTEKIQLFKFSQALKPNLTPTRV
jgi:cytochrome c2